MEPDMSLDNIKMTSSDLLEKKDLDSGGFGKVSLCFHRTHGFVILKKVYTGPNRAEWVGNRDGRPHANCPQKIVVTTCVAKHMEF